MFGPDKCGMSSKVHFIVRFKNPVTGEVEEKHSKQAGGKMDFFEDKKTHLFALSKSISKIHWMLFQWMQYVMTSHCPQQEPLSCT